MKNTFTMIFIKVILDFLTRCNQKKNENFLSGIINAILTLDDSRYQFSEWFQNFVPQKCIFMSNAVHVENKLAFILPTS